MGGTLSSAAILPTPYDSNWTAVVGNGAKWVWSTTTMPDRTVTVTEAFVRPFTVNGVASSSTITVAADNTYSIYINGHFIGKDLSGNTYTTGSVTYAVDPSFLNIGSNNALYAEVENIGDPADSPYTNPAGLIYDLSISSNSCPNDPTPPAPQPPTIHLNGDNPLTIDVGTAFVDPGATGNDTYDGPLTPVVTGGTDGHGGVDTSSATTTTITYTVTNTSGLSASVTREVDVVNLNPCTYNQTDIVSGTDDLLGGTLAPAALVPTPYDTGWTAAIGNGAKWVWSTTTLPDPNTNDTETFVRSFTVGGIATSSTLTIAADDTYSVSLNGHLIGSSSGGSYQNADTYTIDPSFLNMGSDNTLVVTVANIAIPADSPYTNPAGLLYDLSISSGSCPNDPVPPSPQPPTITLNGSNPTTVNVGDTFTDPGAVGNDPQDGPLTPVVTGGTNGIGSVDTSNATTTIITYTVTDSFGLSASTTREVDVVNLDNGCGSDCGNDGGNPATTTDPLSIAQSPDISASTTDSSGLIVEFIDPEATTTATTTDGSVATTSVSCVPPSGSLFAVGTTTVMCTATDSLGTTATSSFDVGVALIADNTCDTDCGGDNGGATTTNPLSITQSPDISTTTTDSSGIVVDFVNPEVATTATTSDDGIATTSVSCVPPSGSQFPIGTTAVMCTANDSVGNTATSSFNVTVTLSGGNDTNAITTTNNGGGGSSSGSSSGSSGSSVFTPASSSGTPATALFNTCPLITTYMRLGIQNDPVEVSKLQAFLHNVEGYDTAVTGTFDQKTDAAVKAFQAKYLLDVMGPWHASDPTGYVYITTKKKINEIACGLSLNLSVGDLAIIEAYIQAQISGNNGQTGTATSSVGTPDNSISTTTVPLIGQNAPTGAENTAAAINAGSSFFADLWNFIKSLF